MTVSYTRSAVAFVSLVSCNTSIKLATIGQSLSPQPQPTISGKDFTAIHGPLRQHAGHHYWYPICYRHQL
jgi:hypothetical protein